MRKIILVGTFLFFGVCSGYCDVKYHSAKEKTCGYYVIKIYEHGVEGYPMDRMGKLEIYKNNELILVNEDEVYEFGLMLNDAVDVPIIEECPDITGDGVQDVVISSYSGGAHCCSSTHIYSLGNEFQLLDTIESKHSDGRFEDLDKDEIPEFIANDWTFAYWHTNFSDSPAPEIILKFKNGKYQLAMDLMKKPVPSIAEEKRIIDQVQIDI